MTATPCFVDDKLLRVGTLEFHYEHPIGSVPEGRLPVEKPRALIEGYVELCRTLRPRRIVELGVYKGGSTALLSELANPEKLVAFDLSSQPVSVLEKYVEEHERSRSVRPYFGVNQADRRQITEIISTEFGAERLDLVIDDASHLYGESRASFETLFPLVRPGGLYLIEDWRWQHQLADAAAAQIADAEMQSTDLPKHLQHAIVKRMFEVAEKGREAVVPLSRLVLELVLARASSGDVVAEVAIGPYWAVIERGAGALDADTFSVADAFHDHFNLLGPN